MSVMTELYVSFRSTIDNFYTISYHLYFIFMSLYYFLFRCFIQKPESILDTLLYLMITYFTNGIFRYLVIIQLIRFYLTQITIKYK